MVHDEQSRQHAIDVLNDLAHYIRAGGRFELSDPAPRGRKGPDRSAQRFITFTVFEVRRFDAMGWELMLRRMKRRRG